MADARNPCPGRVPARVPRLRTEYKMARRRAQAFVEYWRQELQRLGRYAGRLAVDDGAHGCVRVPRQLAPSNL